jgi:ADP-ribose pyrophosphatase YjhB (NUDIX family)
MAAIKVRLRLVIIKSEKALLMYDSIQKFHFWIGGKLEYGETIAQGIDREIREECGEDAKFTFQKILYIRDFLLAEVEEHAVELFILGDLNKFEELEAKGDPEFDGKKWLNWIDVGHLPADIKPRLLSEKIVTEYHKGFPSQGEYVGDMN